MPFLFDFDNCVGDIQEVTISPKGWVPNLVIEYGPAQANRYDTFGSVVWRIKGTTHTFTIYEKELNERIKGGNYAKHFKETLEGFREDYLSWWKSSEYEGCDWREDYRKQYGKLIIEKTEDNQSQNQENKFKLK